MVATLYDELGAGPASSLDELRRAYRVRARALHPDRLADRPEREVQAGAEGMARLNHAWAVLSDRHERARYDAALRRASTASVPSQPPLHIASGHGARVLRPLPFALLGLVMVVIFVVTAYASHAPVLPAPPVIGQCLHAEPGLDRFVACGSPHEGRVMTEGTSPIHCPSGTAAHLVQGPTHFTVCLAGLASAGAPVPGMRIGP